MRSLERPRAFVDNVVNIASLVFEQESGSFDVWGNEFRKLVRSKCTRRCGVREIPKGSRPCATPPWTGFCTGYSHVLRMYDVYLCGPLAPAAGHCRRQSLSTRPRARRRSFPGACDRTGGGGAEVRDKPMHQPRHGVCSPRDTKIDAVYLFSTPVFSLLIRMYRTLP